MKNRIDVFKIRISIILFFIVNLFPSETFSQVIWQSSDYDYSVELPEGFTETKTIGQNVDYKATRDNNSVVVVVKILPAEFTSYSIWDLLGDLETFGKEWQDGAREHMNNPLFLKYGKTEINGQDTFWYDYTTESPKMYSKTYQVQKGRYLFTFTLTSTVEDYNTYSPIWYRFKNNIKF